MTLSGPPRCTSRTSSPKWTSRTSPLRWTSRTSPHRWSCWNRSDDCSRV